MINMDYKTKNESVALGIIGATLLIVGVFAPVVTAGNTDYSYFDISKEGAIA